MNDGAGCVDAADGVGRETCAAEATADGVGK